MSLLDWILQTLFPKKSNTWRDAFAADNNSVFSSTLKKELKNNGNEKKIIKAVLREFRALHPDIDISDSVLKEVILASLYSSQRVSSLSEAFSFLPPKDAQKITGDISFCTNFNRTKYRALSAGLAWYCWSGAKACPLHKHMNNVFVRFNAPPSIEILRDGSPIPHHAGTQWGCKCYATPIVEVKGVYKPPYKVCTGKEILRMSQRDFLKIYK